MGEEAGGGFPMKLRDELQCNAACAPVNMVPRLVTGQWLAHAKLTLAERAYLAGDLYTGAAQLVQPTMLQSAALAKVNATYAHAAFRRPADRLLVESGAVPLVPSVMPKALPKPVDPVEQLADVVAAVGVNGTLGLLAQIETAVAIR
jgi:hypothetical protein